MVAKRSTEITDSMVREAIANLGEISVADRAMAQSALAKKGFPDDDDNVLLYLALRKGCIGRVSDKLFGKWVKKDIVRSCTRREYWVVPAANMTDVRRKRILEVDPEAIWDGSKIARIDPSIVLSENFIVDQVVDRNMLGVGAFLTEVTTGSEEVMRGHPSAAVLPLADGPRVSVPPALAVEIEEPVAPAGAPEAAASTTATGAVGGCRVVMRHPSNVSEGEPSEEGVAHDLAQSTVACFAAGRYYTADAHLSDFAINKVREYVEVMRNKVTQATAFDASSERAFAESLTPKLRKYPKYVTKALLNSEAFDHLGHFAGALKDLLEVLPSLVDNLGKALIQLAAFPLTSDGSMQLGFLGLGERHTLRSSKLYKTFEKRRMTAKIAALRAASAMSDAERKASVEALLQAAATDEDKQDLIFARALFSEMAGKEKAMYLFSSGKIERLRSWMPQHPMLRVEAWLHADTAWAEVSDVEDPATAPKTRNIESTPQIQKE